METPNFKTKKELFNWLVQEKETLIATKKAAIKYADGVSFNFTIETDKGKVIKANDPVTEDLTELKVRAVINTTNLMDSHKDVHLPGIWTKSLKENNAIMHIQEHKMAFDKIIANGNDLKPSANTYKWSELGYNYEGKTQALVFDSTVKMSRNKYMFDQYKNGYVTNHSVGMVYVKLELAVNDKDYKEEFEAWEKYIDQVANKETAEDNGYFWAVKEAKVIEGSAVPIGSNFATPTLDNNIKEIEPLKGTQQDEPRDALTINDFKTELKNLLR